MLSIWAQAVFSSCVYVLAQSSALTLAYKSHSSVTNRAFDLPLLLLITLKWVLDSSIGIKVFKRLTGSRRSHCSFVGISFLLLPFIHNFCMFVLSFMFYLKFN